MAPATVEATSSTKCCRICTVPIHFSRLGVHACRACAAFYKRTKIGKKKYVCRQGDGRCVFRKHEKFMCRSCRYEKCVELGMEYSPAGKELEDDEEEHADEPEGSNLQDKPLLEAMKIAYEDSYKKRLADELEIAKKHGLRRLENPTEEFYVSNLQSFNDIFPTMVKEIIGMFERVFPFMKELIVEDKAALFQDFIGKFGMIEGFYRTFNYVPEEQYFFCTSLITCVDCENVDQWIRDEDKVERKADFRGLIKNYCDEYTPLLLPLFFTIEKFTQQEFMALLIVGFCGIDLKLDLPDFIFDKLESIRKQVFSELQDYYKQEDIADVSSRMGKLMTVSHATNEAGLLMNEEFRTYAALFDDINSSDSLLREIFLR